MLISKEVLHQTLAISPIFANEILIGMGYGWLAPTIRRLRNSDSELISLNDEQCSWLGSLHDFGRILGTFFASFLLDVVGRKMALTLSTLIYLVMWPPIAFTNSVAILYAIRFIFGVTVGVNDVCSAIYLAENCGTRQRSIFGSITMACYYGGELLEFAISTYLKHTNVALLNTAIAVCALSSIVWCTESAHFLIAKGKFEKAESNLRWLKGGHLDPGEFEQLKHDVVEQTSTTSALQDLAANAVYRKTVLMMLALSTLMMVTGQPAIVTFASLIFVRSSLLTADEYTTVFGIWQFVAVCMSLFVVNRCNRKTLLVGSLALMAASQCAAAALYFWHAFVRPVPHFPWLIFAAVASYATVFCLGVHPISFVIRGEVFPHKIKAIGGAISVTGNSVAAFATTKIFLLVADACGMYVNFVGYAVFSAATALYVFWAVPETKGKSLMEIRKIMETW